MGGTSSALFYREGSPLSRGAQGHIICAEIGRLLIQYADCTVFAGIGGAEIGVVVLPDNHLRATEGRWRCVLDLMADSYQVVARSRRNALFQQEDTIAF